MSSSNHENSRYLEWSILKGAIENTNEAFVTIDRFSIVIFFNKAAEKMFGYRREEVLGKSLSLILSSGCREGHDLAVKQYVETRKGKMIGHENDFTAMRRDGSTFAATISFSVAELDGELFFTGIVRDVTETRALQKQIIRAERLTALGQAVAEISHEIKNPLTLIGGFTQQLIKTVAEPQQQEKLRLISKEVGRLENLLIELKDLYTPRGLDIRNVEIADLLQEIFGLAEADCKNKKIDFSLLPPSPSGVFVRADREKLKQVLVNVVKNSIEAMTSGGSLAIKTKTFDESVEISITDTGPGIPKELQEKIFLPFFTTKSQGTGLGLCISKRIIEDHATASFQLTSEEGQGTVVNIVLSRV